MTPEQARVGALLRFAVGITAFNLVGHTLLGFEVSLLQMLICIVTAYLVEILLEAIGAWSERRAPLFAGSLWQLILFLLPAHISGSAISMVLYPGDRLLPYIVAPTVAIASKSIFTVNVNGRRRHFLNPSNAGLLALIFLFPSVSLVPPYQFTENLWGYWYWALPAFFAFFGTFINAVFTKKLPLIAAWLAAFVAQAVLRHFLYSSSLTASLAPMLGAAFLLFTFYMITDPQTSPAGYRGQIIYGLSIGGLYGVLIGAHVVYTLFVALFVVCVARGIVLYVTQRTILSRLQALARRQWIRLGGLPAVPKSQVAAE
jgi:Na+-translocating ferredoxin:NAD+ oxidoreductase RnfD subunit